MALLSLLFVLMQSLMQYPQPAGDGLDEATHRQMQEREELLDREMARLLQELEQGPLEQQDEGWGALLFGALQQWPFWALAGLLLLLGLWFSCRRSPEDKGSSGGIEEEEDACDFGNKRGILLVDRIQCPVEDVERGRSVAAELMESFTRVFIDSVSNSFYPVPQEAIGVGSAFEGWSPREQDVVYRLLVPLNPPPGHAFHLELNSAGQMAARTFCVRVELVCMCEREQLGKKLLCFLHHSQEELRRKQKPSLLETLCTGSYLDVEKTSHWFYQLVRCSWLHLPQSYSWHLVFQPCSRSCQFRLSGSSIFVTWPETYAVAEAKFFQHVARQVPCESLHLKCLQLFTCILRGTGFSSSTWKTVVMHVLTTVPLSQWRRREFARRLWDIMAYLRRCLQLKHLEHFVLGNQRLPAEISLPPAMRTVEPLNLFQHLARDPAAHAEEFPAQSCAGGGGASHPMAAT
uniref:Mab-21-like HhH/H2TH-like domain-containing protein n=1 Tax=Corvus moneduloides TaxID=1196302 RepID=A0A8U7M0F7_CORMO